MVLVGSLATGSYRTGRSDIDTIVIVREGASAGTPGAVRAIADRYRDLHRIPKDFGAVVIREGELPPPHDPERGLATEALRLRRQGVVLWGDYDVLTIPEPPPEDLRAQMRAFYPWLRANYVDRRPDEERTADALVNTLLYELRLLVWDRSGEYVLDKRELIPRFLRLAGADRYAEPLAAIGAYVRGDGGSGDLEQLEATLRDVSLFVREEVPWCT